MMVSVSVWALFLRVVLLQLPFALPARPRVRVSFSSGTAEGVCLDSGVRAFLGVPFAASTAGANRFRAPQPLQMAASIIDATHYGPGCPQVDHNPDVPTEQSEDCLNLNVWTPVASDSPSDAELVPVGLFFHGGAFKEGSNRGPFNIYNGARLAARENIVVVNANYRLGALGFLTNGKAGIMGNFGIQDQRAAMKWVQRNIQKFGGDPRRVAIWGESAGAQSVLVHLFSPFSRGLFSRAIMESNPAGYLYRDVKEATALGEGMMKDLGCAPPNSNGSSALACLRSANLSAILKASRRTNGLDIVEALLEGGKLLDLVLQWVPTSSTPDLPVSPLANLSKMVSRVPVIIGTNANEGVTFVDASLQKPLSGLKYELIIDSIFGFGTSASREIKRIYPSNLHNSSDSRPALAMLLTDFWFKCASAHVAQSLQEGPGGKVYLYNHSSSFGPAMWPMYNFPFCVGKVCHGAELPFVFENSANWTFTPEEEGLSKEIGGLWGAFIRGEDAGQSWPLYSGSKMEVMVFQLPKPVVSTTANKVCPLWDRVGYNK